MKNNKICLFLLVLFFIPLTNLYAWEGVPLRTTAQLKDGVGGGEGGQVIFTMRVSPSNPNYIYMATDTSRVWASIDGGISWKNKPTGFVTKGAVSLAIDPNNEKVVLVAGAVHTTTKKTTALYDGIYRTTDAGNRWSLVYQTGFYRDIGQDNILFINSKTVYCGTHEEGVLKSNDGGVTWDSLNILSNKRIGQIANSIGDRTKLFIGTTSGLYSLVNDTVLSEIGAGLPDKDILAMTVHPSNSNIVYVISAGIVYKSIDSGLHFVAANEKLPKGKVFKNIEISPVNPNNLYVSTEGGVWHSHDAGASWIATKSVDPEGYLADINQTRPANLAWTAGSIIAPGYTDENVAFGSGQGHYPVKTTDGGVIWKYSGSGFMGVRGAFGRTSFVWDVNNSLRFAICATDYGIFLTEDGGSSFKNIHVPRFKGKSSKVGAFYPEPGSKRIVATVGNWKEQQIIVSTDNGNHWMRKSNTTGLNVHPFIAFHPQKPKNVYAGKFFSANKGDTWVPLSRVVYAMFPKNGDIVYSASIGPKKSLVIYKSTDMGKTWTTPYAPIDKYNSSFIREIAVDPNDQDRLYVASESKGVFIWNGSFWGVRGELSGLSRDEFGRYSSQKIVVDPNNSNYVYIGKASPHLGHSNGVFMSTDKGENWKKITSDLGSNINLTALSVNPHNGFVYLGSSTGNYKYDPHKPTKKIGPKKIALPKVIKESNYIEI